MLARTAPPAETSALTPVSEPPFGEGNVRCRRGLRPLDEGVEPEQDLAEATFYREQDPVATVLCERTHFIDVPAQVSRAVLSECPHLLHRRGDHDLVVRTQVEEELAYGSAAARGDVVTPASRDQAPDPGGIRWERGPILYVSRQVRLNGSGLPSAQILDPSSVSCTFS